MAKDWTPDLLKIHFDQRFIDQNKAVEAALIAADKAVQAALLAAKEAVTKAEVATEKRFDGVNEFRAQLADQAATFMPRAEYTIQHRSLADIVDASVARLDDKINTATSQGERAGGASQTSQRYTALLVPSVISLLTSIAVVVVAIILH